MPITILEDYLLCIFIGFGLGVLASWIYMKARIQRNTIGQVIETALIEQNVNDLETLSHHLNHLVIKIKDSSEELKEQIENARDIEISIPSLQDTKKELNYLTIPVKIDLLEKNK